MSTIPRLLLLLGCVLATACGAQATTEAVSGPAATSPAATSPADTSPADTSPADTDTVAGFPTTLDSCGHELVLPEQPTRVLALGSNPFGLIAGVDALDQVTLRTGQLSGDHWDPADRAAIEAIDSLTTQTGPTGGVEIAREVVVEADPDLVIGYETDTLTIDTLAEVGIPFYVLPSFCDPPPAEVDFTSVAAQVRTFGQLLGQPEAAAATVAELEGRLDDVDVPDLPFERAAVLYAPTAGGALYAYGRASMAHPQLETLGLSNVFRRRW